MSRTDDRTEPKLPVTAEVGSEGGSYADPTVQRATHEGDIQRGEGHGGASSVANYAVASEAVSSGGIGGHDPAGGMVRHATEAPPSASTEGGVRRQAPSNWRTGLAGAAAGAAIVLGISRLRNRS